MQSRIVDIPWNDISDVNELAFNSIESIESILNELCPIAIKSHKINNNVKWIDDLMRTITIKTNELQQNPTELSNLFNEFFINSIEDITSEIPKYNNCDRYLKKNTYGYLPKFEAISMSELKKIFMSLRHTSPAEDGINKGIVEDILRVNYWTSSLLFVVCFPNFGGCPL
ncbi:hypothetical protein WA026_021995 [Henosepilachna vigintioctopunctata]|uniref:Uncharacterized protein n=1 Tax=Henosepilachna vigintioctopunctata TaxID=420089 RepID=A0AAW1VII1_9CUCU